MIFVKIRVTEIKTLVDDAMCNFCTSYVISFGKTMPHRPIYCTEDIINAHWLIVPGTGRKCKLEEFNVFYLEHSFTFLHTMTQFKFWN